MTNICSSSINFIFWWLTLIVWHPLYPLTHCWPITMFSAVDLKPSKPTNLHVSEVNGESVVLKWDPPENHAVVTNYTIMYRKAASKGSYSQVQFYCLVELSSYFFIVKSSCCQIFFLAFIFTFWIEFSLPKLTVPGSVQMYLVRNLQPNTLYEFQIVANGPFGKSKSAALGSALNSGKRNIRN